MSLTKVTYSMIEGPLANATDFGVVGDGSADDTAALQAFLNYVTTNGCIGQIKAGTYKITAPLTITLGSKGFSIQGAASTATLFRAATTFSGGTSVIKIVGDGTPLSWSISGIDLRPLTGLTAGTATTGIQIGDASVASIQILGYQFSKIADVMVANFEKAWNIAHARMIYFDRCGAWNSSLTSANTCLYMTQNGAFTGDMVFDTCQFVSSTVAGTKAIEIHSPVGPYNITNGNFSISGLTFRSCDIYSGEKAVSMYAGAVSWITDVWFVAGCQVDQETDYCIYAESNNSATLISDIHVEGAFLNKANNATIGFYSTGTGGTVKDVWVNDCIIYQPQDSAIVFDGPLIINAQVNGNSIVGCGATGGAISFSTVSQIVCTNNVLRKDLNNKAPNYFIDISSGCDNIMVCNNDSRGTAVVDGIRDQSGDVGKTITGNLGYNPIPQTSITVGASPFLYKNITGAAQYVSIGGGTITALYLDGLGIFPTTDNIIVVPNGSTLGVEYSVAPLMFSQGF